MGKIIQGQNSRYIKKDFRILNTVSTAFLDHFQRENNNRIITLTSSLCALLRYSFFLFLNIQKCLLNVYIRIDKGWSIHPVILQQHDSLNLIEEFLDNKTNKIQYNKQLFSTWGKTDEKFKKSQLCVAEIVFIKNCKYHLWERYLNLSFAIVFFLRVWHYFWILKNNSKSFLVPTII